MNKRKLKKAIKRLKHLPRGGNFLRYILNKIKGFIFHLLKNKKVACPSHIMIEVTNHCQLHCITCAREYKYGQEMNKGHIEIENLKKIVDDVYPYIDSIGLTGLGEPLLYKNLPEALQYIKDKSQGIITFISTNAGLNNTTGIVKQIAKNTDTFQVSIDGIEDVYEKIRINGNYNQFIQNVKDLVEIASDKESDVMFNAVILKENYHQMPDFLNLCNELNIKYLHFNTFNLASVTNIDVSYYDFYQSDEFKNKLRDTYEIAAKYPEIEFTTWDFATPNSFKKCNFPWSHFYFTWDGFLVPCCAKPFPKELSFGNAFRESAISTLNSKRFQDFRGLWYKNTVPGFCKKCHMVDLKPTVGL